MFFATSIALVPFLVSGQDLPGCQENLPNIFTNEKGSFEFQWYINSTTLVVQYSLPGTSFNGIGLGGAGGMADVDMTIGWVNADGSFEIYDYWSTDHVAPSLDTTLGGTNDVVPLCGRKEGNWTVLRYAKPLITEDIYDTPLKADYTDVIFAWQNGNPGQLSYHGDNHNNVQIDLGGKTPGYPDNRFGQGESGLLARQLVQEQSVGFLATLQTEPNAGLWGMPTGFPFTTVCSFADTVPSTGKLILLLTDVERSVINIGQNPKASFGIAQHFDPVHEPMMEPRLTLLGSLQTVPTDEVQSAKQAYLAKHPIAAAWCDFGNFQWYYFIAQDVYWVGGFGTTNYLSWVYATDYFSWTISDIKSSNITGSAMKPMKSIAVLGK